VNKYLHLVGFLLISKYFIFSTDCIYVFRTTLKISSHCLPEQHQLFGFYTGKTASSLSVKKKSYLLFNCNSCLKREFKSSEISRAVPAVVVMVNWLQGTERERERD